MAAPTTVALVLGGGGARGYAHIGAVEALAERGYDIVTVAGTSMGALVGGLHAAGALDDYAAWARRLTQRDVLRLLDPAFRGPGAIRATKILAKVTELLEETRIEELPVPYTAVATDLLAGREVWFQSGPLVPAIRASIALPSFITPVMVGGRLLADGGMMNPLPVAPTAASDADLTVAVSLAEEHLVGSGNAPTHMSASSARAQEADEASRFELARLLDNERVRSITDWFQGVWGTEDADGDLEPDEVPPSPAAPGEAGIEPPPAGLRTMEVMQLALDALQGAVTRYRVAGYPPDLLVTIPRTACRTLDFHRAEEMIALGRERTLAALDREGSPPGA